MKTTGCRRFDAALADGEHAVAALDVHAASCAECRERLDVWKSISDAAPSLKKSWDSPELLPRIARSLAEESRRPSSAVSGPSGASGASFTAPRRSRFAWVPAAAAAALFVLAMIGLSVFRPGESGRDPLSNLAVSRQPLMNDETLNDVEGAEKKYLESIEQLSAATRARLESPATPLLMAYREKLQLLDSAIAELRGQIEQNRFNTHLRRELLAMYQEKQRTLQDLTKEAKS